MKTLLLLLPLFSEAHLPPRNPAIGSSAGSKTDDSSALADDPFWNSVARSLPAIRRRRNDDKSRFSFRRSNSLRRVQQVSRGWLWNTTPQSLVTTKRRPSLRSTLDDTVSELNSVKEQLRGLQDQLNQLLHAKPAEAEEESVAFDAAAVEKWAIQQLNDDSSDWEHVQCQKMLRRAFDKHNQTSADIKWIKAADDEEDDSLWPCVRMTAKIPASCELVRLYLSKPSTSNFYNALLDKFRVLHDNPDGSKVCWAQTPKILFIKPRQFINVCNYKIRSRETAIVNIGMQSFKNETATAVCFRGATFIGPDPDDPACTTIRMVAHATPGRDLAPWACRTAIKTLAPIEPYKLFHKIRCGVKETESDLQDELTDLTSLVNNSEQQCQNLPVGIAQFGYAVFWPGKKEQE